ncbi:MAG TPA: DUF4411 family protein [Kofleriaceae bacterium]|nr:DUF4411 family protein [Kofleriaceae bacterium]
MGKPSPAKSGERKVAEGAVTQKLSPAKVGAFKATTQTAKATYSFDTSAFIQSCRRYWPFDIAPTFWAALEKMIANRVIVSSYPVRQEIEEKDDALCAWVKAQGSLFRKVDMAVQARVTDILTMYPNWVDVSTGKNDADPFVIGLAMVENLIVVSDEIHGGPTNLKIPYVCGELKVRHLGLHDFMRQVGLRW